MIKKKFLKSVKSSEFTLNKIDIQSLSKEYNLLSFSSIFPLQTDKINESTPIESIIPVSTYQPIQTIVTKEKIKTKQYLSFVFNKTNENVLDRKTEIPCFYCHRKYRSCPLIVPISVEQYTFYGDAVVCSFNCMLSYISENDHNKLYNNSITYMLKMYKLIFGKYPEKKINKSPPFYMRQEYGGALSDNEYERFTQSVEIIDTKQVLMHPVSRILDVRE
jgi:hypothetical protein